MKIRFKVKRWHKIIGIIVLFFAILLFFLSTIVRIWLVNHSEDVLGRKIELEDLHFNYLKCSVTAENFVMYEANKKDTFVSFDCLYVNFAPWHLLRNEYAFTEITLKKPDITIINGEKGFNFDDLFSDSDTTKTVPEEESKDTVRFLIRNLSIIDGNIHYKDKASENLTEVKKLNINVPEIAWNNSNSALGINFILGEKGTVTLGGSINQSAGKYSVTAKTENIDISPFAGYLKPYIAAGSVNGLLYSDVRLNGELENPLNIKIFGDIGIHKLSVTDALQNKLCSIDNIHVKADSIDLANSRYDFSTIRLTNPWFSASIDKAGSNIDRFLAPYFADTVQAGAQTVASPEDTLQMHYSIDSLVITGGQLAFADLTLNRPFNFNLSDINVEMLGFNDMGTKIPLTFKMLLNGSGVLSGSYTFNMVDNSQILFDGNISNLSMISLAPYSEYYLARPVTKGTFNYSCKLAMTKTSLNNQNHLKVVNLEFGKKTKDTTAYKAPIPLALYIIKDRNGIIEFDLPVSGNPSSPTFKLGRIIWKTLEEFLLKAVTAPFNALGKLVGADPGSVKEIPFEFAQDSLTDSQRARLDKIAEIIQKKPELSFSFIQTTNPEKEMSLVAVREAKKIFVTGKLLPNASPETIKRLADNTSETDKEFLAFLGMPEGGSDKQYQAACEQKVGADVIRALFNALLARREAQLKSYLASKGISNLRFSVIDFANQPEEMKTPKFVVDITLL